MTREQAGAEAVQGISSALVSAAGETMQRHGDDPNGMAIVAAGFAMAINSINRELDPKFARTVVALVYLATQ